MPTAQTLVQLFAASGTRLAGAEHRVGSLLCFMVSLAASPAAKRRATEPGDAAAPANSARSSLNRFRV